MKAKITTENGASNIILTPENEFERVLIENFAKEKRNKNQEVFADFRIDNEFHIPSNHRIEIEIKTIKN
jgi:hypothetical protein